MSEGTSAAVELAMMAAASIVADPARLSDLEREDLAAIRGERRREEWIRGRLAIRRVIDDPAMSIVVDPDGAPRAVGGRPCSVSLSHDGAWIAVAVVGDGMRVGVDLCARQHASRVKRIHAWLGVVTTLDPVVAWTALEVGLKLRRLSVEALRDRELVVERRDGAVCVRGLGADATVMVRGERDYVVAWAAEPLALESSAAAPGAVSSLVVSSAASLVVSSSAVASAVVSGASSPSASSPGASVSSSAVPRAAATPEIVRGAKA